MTFMAQRLMSQMFSCMLYKQVKIEAQHDHMSLWLTSKRRALRVLTPSTGEVAVTAGFVPFKVPGFPVVAKTVFPSPLSKKTHFLLLLPLEGGASTTASSRGSFGSLRELS